ncbi:hypothetical protein [Ralstonia pseudosolanacearum]|uniref:hypothetical protein n=1 Tax=Ralstonia pseudosolanacearum TaxID=1310165 RepID=UPI003CF7EC2D
MFGLFKKKTSTLDAADDHVMRSWLSDNGFNMEDFSFSVHQDPNLMSDGSTSVVVGFGRADGETNGFVIEINQGTVVEARTIHPGAASYHKQVAAQASYAGSKLIHELTSKSLEMQFR